MLGTNPYAEEALPLASVARGNEGMLRTSAPVGNERMLSDGATDKVEMNDQPEKNFQYKVQSEQQNAASMMPQAQAQAIRGMRKSTVDMSQSEYEAQEMLQTRLAEVLYANDGGSALMRMTELGSSPAQERNTAQGMYEAGLAASGNNPQLGFKSTRFYS